MSDAAPHDANPVARGGRDGDPSGEGAIRAWLVAKLSEARRVDPAEIRTDEPLIESGLDSMQAVVLVGELEDRLGIRFRGNPLIDHPTVDCLARFLADQIARGIRLVDPADR